MIAAIRRRLAAVPAALWIVLLAAVWLRIALWASYSPAAVNLLDSASYAWVAGGDLFGDAARNAGYPLFMRAVHGVSSQLEVTIALQHLLGIATGLLLYATVRRAGAAVWVGVVAAAAILLPLDQIFLEHAVMTEALWTFLIVAALYAAVRALYSGPRVWPGVEARLWWIGGAGAALAASVWVRPLSLVLIPFIALWLALAIPGAWKARVGRALLAVVTAAIPLIGYGVLQDAETGEFGLSRSGGWALYARTAPFADCAEFEPPEGTRSLCEATPPSERVGPDFYGHDPRSPARQRFGWPPEGDGQLREFATSAIIAQPTEYLKDVGRDFIRYFHPTFQPLDFSGVGYDVLDVARRAGGVEITIAEALNSYYADDQYVIDGGVRTLSDIQSVIRIHPKLLLVCLLLGVTGLFFGSGRSRWALVLFLGTSLLLLIVPPASVIWTSRYAIPANGPIVAAGAIGLWLIAGRVLARPSRAAHPA